MIDAWKHGCRRQALCRFTVDAVLSARSEMHLCCGCFFKCCKFSNKPRRRFCFMHAVGSAQPSPGFKLGVLGHPQPPPGSYSPARGFMTMKVLHHMEEGLRSLNCTATVLRSTIVLRCALQWCHSSFAAFTKTIRAATYCDVIF